MLGELRLTRARKRCLRCSIYLRTPLTGVLRTPAEPGLSAVEQWLDVHAGIARCDRGEMFGRSCAYYFSAC